MLKKVFKSYFKSSFFKSGLFVFFGIILGLSIIGLILPKYIIQLLGWQLLVLLGFVFWIIWDLVVLIIKEKKGKKDNEVEKS